MPTHRPLLLLVACAAMQALPPCACGAELIDVSPLRDDMLRVEFGEGTILYPRIADPASEQTLRVCLLDTAKAVDASNYRVTSGDDPDYGGEGAVPLHVGRKSKGWFFNKDLHAYRQGAPTHLSRHWIYLRLPRPLRPDCRYTLATAGLTERSEPFEFVFDADRLRSPTIHLNQLGFRPDGPKYAYLSQSMGDFAAPPHADGGLVLDDYVGGTFRVVRETDDATVFTGRLELQQPKSAADTRGDGYGPTRNLTRADVWQADFGALSVPGRYRVVVERMGCSQPFDIGSDVFREAYVAAMRGLFFQRAGIDRDVREWGGAVYPAGFVTNAVYYVPAAGRKEGGEITDRSRPVTGVWGWYHDAGDWDGYARHTGVPATLLLAYELAPDKFGDGDIGNRWRRPPSTEWVDEGANGIPDILDEAGWLLACNRRARRALLEQGHGTGGVPAYFGAEGCGKANASWLDPRPLAVHGEDPRLTAEHAGLCAWYGAALERAGRPAAEVAAWVAEARDAFAWAESHGGLDGEEGWLAQIGLYRATGEAERQRRFLERFNPKANWEYWGGADALHFALFLYALLPTDHPGLDAARQAELRDLVARQADAFWVGPGLKRGFRAAHIAPYQRNFLGTFSTPRTLFPMVAHALTGEGRFAHAAQFAADYTLGGNPMDLVWLSGVGTSSDEAVFHPDSWAIEVPGRVGPNQRCLPGLTAFGTHFSFDWFGPSYQHSGSEDFSRSTAYPVIWRKTGGSFGGMGPAWRDAKDIPGWAPADSVGDGPANDSPFPPAEARFPNRWSIPGSEFTVNQVLCHNAFTYGLLTGGFRRYGEPDRRRRED